MQRESTKVALTCPQCGADFNRPPSQAFTTSCCSYACAALAKRVRKISPLPLVYVITHVPSGRVYVGSTADARYRWKHHRQTLAKGCHASPSMQAAWDADGAEAFRFGILEYVRDIALLRAAEQRWLDKLEAATPTSGFNSDTDVWGVGRVRTRESVERTAAAHRGRKRPPETGAKISARTKGRKASNRLFSDEQVATMRARLAAGISDSQVARECGTSPQVIRRIRIGAAYPITA